MRNSPLSILIVVAAVAIAACQSPAIQPQSTSGLEDVRETLRKKLPGTEITEVNRTEVDGVFEVVAGRNLFYTDLHVRYMFIGSLYDIASRRDVTADRKESLSRIVFSNMPEEAAIVIRQGTGANKIAVFSDPDCPYCQKIEPELAKLKDVTIYVYLMPLPMHSDAARKSASVWCSKDRGNAWRNLMIKKEAPNSGDNCEQPLAKILSVAQGYGVRGTPTLVRADGRVHVGFMTAEKIEQWMTNNGGKS